MWKRFTRKAQEVVFSAQGDGQRYGGGYVATEHLLLGILRQEDSSAIDVLEALGVNLRQLLAEIEREMPCGEHVPSQNVLLNPGARRAVDFAIEEAGGEGADHIGTAHLLLGLIREEDGLASQVLGRIGVGIEAARREASKVLTLL